MMCQRIGCPPISIIGFGTSDVSSDMRVPNPPASRIVFMAEHTPRTAPRPHTGPHSPNITRFFDFPPFSLLDSTERAYVRLIVIGLVIIGLMLFRPQGIFGSRKEMVLE